MSRALRKRREIGRLSLRNCISSASVVTGTAGAVVSMTSYGKRLRDVHLTIESIGCGDLLPSRLILWLDDIGAVRKPPAPLARLQRRGLEICACKNYGPHKKYYPYVESQEGFFAPLVTADDDVIYPCTWLSGLVRAHEEFPACVNCYRARTILLTKSGLAPYRDWPLCHSSEPRPTVIATGVSGVIYPPGLLQVLREAGIEFESRCPRSDDLWLHVQALRAGFSVRQIRPAPSEFPYIPGSQVDSLYIDNCVETDGNDRQSAVTYESRDLDVLVSGAEADWSPPTC
jgi:hypothetical protein